MAATRILIAWHDFGNWRMEFIYQTLSGVIIIVLFVIIIFRVLRTLVFQRFIRFLFSQGITEKFMNVMGFFH